MLAKIAMKKIIYLSIFLITYSLYSQSKEISTLRGNGNYYLANQEYEKAKYFYFKILELDSLNSNAYSGLGLIESNLGNMEKACSLLNKSYQLKNHEVSSIINELCGSIDYNEIMYSKDIDTYPMFKHKNREKYIANKQNYVDNNFVKTLKKQIKLSEILNNFKQLKKDQKISGFKGFDLLINIRFDKNGQFIGDVYVGMRKKTIEKITKEVSKIINETFEIIPAKYKNKNVGTWDGVLATINI